MNCPGKFTWNNPYRPAADIDTDELCFLARYAGAEPWIQVNTAWPTVIAVEFAAEWVQYTNVTKGYGVKYWEIGDEGTEAGPGGMSILPPMGTG
ncbi:MAG: hypothetical protein AB1700_17325 [Bacillota bacterium]